MTSRRPARSALPDHDRVRPAHRLRAGQQISPATGPAGLPAGRPPCPGYGPQPGYGPGSQPRLWHSTGALALAMAQHRGRHMPPLPQLCAITGVTREPARRKTGRPATGPWPPSPGGCLPSTGSRLVAAQVEESLHVRINPRIYDSGVDDADMGRRGDGGQALSVEPPGLPQGVDPSDRGRCGPRRATRHDLQARGRA